MKQKMSMGMGGLLSGAEEEAAALEAVSVSASVHEGAPLVEKAPVPAPDEAALEEEAAPGKAGVVRPTSLAPRLQSTSPDCGRTLATSASSSRRCKACATWSSAGHRTSCVGRHFQLVFPATCRLQVIFPGEQPENVKTTNIIAQICFLLSLVYTNLEASHIDIVSDLLETIVEFIQVSISSYSPLALDCNLD